MLRISSTIVLSDTFAYIFRILQFLNLFTHPESDADLSNPPTPSHSHSPTPAPTPTPTLTPNPNLNPMPTTWDLKTTRKV